MEVAVKPVIDKVSKVSHKFTEVSINQNFDDDEQSEIDKHDVIDLVDSSQHSISLRQSAKTNGEPKITESHRSN